MNEIEIKLEISQLEKQFNHLRLRIESLKNNIDNPIDLIGVLNGARGSAELILKCIYRREKECDEKIPREKAEEMLRVQSAKLTIEHLLTPIQDKIPKNILHNLKIIQSWGNEGSHYNGAIEKTVTFSTLQMVSLALSELVLWFVGDYLNFDTANFSNEIENSSMGIEDWQDIYWLAMKNNSLKALDQAKLGKIQKEFNIASEKIEEIKSTYSRNIDHFNQVLFEVFEDDYLELDELEAIDHVREECCISKKEALEILDTYSWTDKLKGDFSDLSINWMKNELKNTVSLDTNIESDMITELKVNLSNKTIHTEEINTDIFHLTTEETFPISDFVETARTPSISINSSIEIDENGDSWIDKEAGLLFKYNRIIYKSEYTGEELPTLILDKVIWLAKNASTFTYSQTGINLNKRWRLPYLEDWNYLSRFIAKKNNEKHDLNSEGSIEINGEECFPNDLLTCIDAGSSSSVVTGNDYYLLGFTENEVFIWDEMEGASVRHSKHLSAIGKKRFKLKSKWEPGMLLPSIYNDYFNVSFLHPKYKVANKLGINYNESTYAIRNKNSFDLSGLVISKNSTPYLTALGRDELVGIRAFTLITDQIKNNLHTLEFKIPDFLEWDDIKPLIDTQSSGVINNTNSFNLGEKIVCINKFKFHNEIDKDLNLNDVYTISEINVNKQKLTLEEFPPENKADKKKWFDFDLFVKI